jgi:hypothetical protein
MSKNFMIKTFGATSKSEVTQPATTTAPTETCTYLTTEELAAKIKYDVRTIRDRLKDSVLLEGRHYIRPFNGRKILFIWETIQADMMRFAMNPTLSPRV